MWILHFLPDSLILWFTNILLLVGVSLTIAGFFVHRIPVIWQYQLPFKVLGIALLSAGIYFRGGYGVEMAWRERVAEVEAQLAKAEAEAAKKNTELQAALTGKSTIIKEKGDTIIKYVDRYRDREVLKTIEGPERVRVEEVIKYVESCPVPKELIDIHNQAAGMKGDKK